MLSTVTDRLNLGMLAHQSRDGHIRSMRIGVIGAGAIGGWIAARLSGAGEDVSILARGSTAESLAAGLELVEQGESISVHPGVSTSARELGEQDLLILAVKATAFAEAACAAAPMIGQRTIILPIMNGVPWWFADETPLCSLDPDNVIAAALPLDQVLGCVVHASSRREGPARVVLVHADRLILGEPAGGASQRVEELCDLFDRAGIHCSASADIRRAIWYKLWGNATVNPLSALTRATTDRLIADPDLRAFMLAAMAELAAVGAAFGCPIEESGEDRIAVTARLGAFKTSMLQDVEAGRPIELQALLGAPCELARAAGIATPNLDLLYAMTGQLAAALDLKT